MKQKLSSIMLLFAAQLGLSTYTYAGPGLFFNTSSLNERFTVNTLVPKHPEPYPQAGIQVLSSLHELSDPYTECSSYDPKTKMCIFSASNTIPKSFTISGVRGNVEIKLCLDGVAQLTCQRYFHHATADFPKQIAFVVPSSQENIPNARGAVGGYIVTCPVLNDGATIGSNCKRNFDNTFNSPQAITFNSAGTVAFIPNFGNASISSCPIANRTTGVLGACNKQKQKTGIPFGTSQHSILGALGVTLNYVFVPAFYNNTVLSCQILNTATGDLDACVTASSGVPLPLMNGPNAITVHPKLNFAYVVNSRGGNVSKCTISGGALVSCEDSGADSLTLTNPLSIDFNQDATYAYIANGNSNNTSTITKCAADLTGVLSACHVQPPTFAFGSAKTGTVTNIFMRSPSNFGYIPNSDTDTISICPEDGSGGLTTCMQVGSQNEPYYFLTPTGIAILTL
jgi:hypothetical protein